MDIDLPAVRWPLFETNALNFLFSDEGSAHTAAASLIRPYFAPICLTYMNHLAIGGALEEQMVVNMAHTDDGSARVLRGAIHSLCDSHHRGPDASMTYIAREFDPVPPCDKDRKRKPRTELRRLSRHQTKVKLRQETWTPNLASSVHCVMGHSAVIKGAGSPTHNPSDYTITPRF